MGNGLAGEIAMAETAEERGTRKDESKAVEVGVKRAREAEEKEAAKKLKVASSHASAATTEDEESDTAAAAAAAAAAATAPTEVMVE